MRLNRAPENEKTSFISTATPTKHVGNAKINSQFVVRLLCWVGLRSAHQRSLLDSAAALLGDAMRGRNILARHAGRRETGRSSYTRFNLANHRLTATGANVQDACYIHFILSKWHQQKRTKLD